MKAFLDWRHIYLAQPWFLLLLLLVPAVFILQHYQSREPSFRLTSTASLKKLPQTLRVTLRPVLNVLRGIALTTLVIALARPQSSSSSETVDSEGIDIVISLDISGSMLAKDFQPNRIEAAKKIAGEFVDQRPTDRIGLVIFSGESFTLCPVTIDHRVVKEQLEHIEQGMLQDGTAIGMGLATGVDRLRYSKAKSKVLILLTDGVNNTGLVDPQTALEIAKAYHVRVYTIGIGTNGNALSPVQTDHGIDYVNAPVQIDEPLLKQIATGTGGNYYRATGNDALRNIYKEIDRLEKVKIETSTYKEYAELYFPFALCAIICLALELLLRYSVFRSVTG